jgi:hypothetical protein
VQVEWPAAARRCGEAFGQRGLTKGVVVATPFRVREHVVRLGERDEALLGAGVGRIPIGVIVEREAPVGGADRGEIR